MGDDDLERRVSEVERLLRGPEGIVIRLALVWQTLTEIQQGQRSLRNALLGSALALVTGSALILLAAALATGKV